jgi:Na+/H+-dicarboxylate symporter
MFKGKAGKLIFKIFFAILIGSILGIILPKANLGIFSLRGLITFSDLFSQFISFFVPIVVLTLVLPGIIELGMKASKLLLLAIIISYSSMLIAGFASFFVGEMFIEQLFSNLKISSIGESSTEYKGFLPHILSPFLDVVGAIVLAFSFGIAFASIKSESILKITKDIESAVYIILQKFLIPVLPFYILCIFAKLASNGNFIASLQSFGLIMIVIFLISNSLTILLIFLTSIVCKKKFLHILKAYIPTYLVALGTQSSKATIPISIESANDIGISKEISEFGIPLLATIHLLGSVVTQIFGAMAIYYIFIGQMIDQSLLISYIFLIATILLAAPGIPGGEPVATKPLLTSFLGFPPIVAEAMFTLGIANDSFATSINVSSDSYILIILDKLNSKFFKKNVK